MWIRCHHTNWSTHLDVAPSLNSFHAFKKYILRKNFRYWFNFVTAVHALVHSWKSSQETKKSCVAAVCFKQVDELTCCRRASSSSLSAAFARSTQAACLLPSWAVLSSSSRCLCSSTSLTLAHLADLKLSSNFSTRPSASFFAWKGEDGVRNNNGKKTFRALIEGFIDSWRKKSWSAEFEPEMVVINQKESHRWQASQPCPGWRLWIWLKC